MLYSIKLGNMTRYAADAFALPDNEAEQFYDREVIEAHKANKARAYLREQADLKVWYMIIDGGKSANPTKSVA